MSRLYVVSWKQEDGDEYTPMDDHLLERLRAEGYEPEKMRDPDHLELHFADTTNGRFTREDLRDAIDRWWEDAFGPPLQDPSGQEDDRGE